MLDSLLQLGVWLWAFMWPPQMMEQDDDTLMDQNYRAISTQGVQTEYTGEAPATGPPETNFFPVAMLHKAAKFTGSFIGIIDWFDHQRDSDMCLGLDIKIKA